MASTRNLAASLQFVLPQLFYQPLTISGDDPALSGANFVKQTILAPPFTWPWNRFEFSLDLDTTDQDYPTPQPTFGYLERAVLDDDLDTDTSKNEITLVPSLGPDSRSQRPSSFAIQNDDNAGNLLIRTNTVPDAAYLLHVQAQKKPVPMTSQASTWTPIPDELAYIYDAGLLAYCSMLTKDARFPIFRQMFTAHLLSRQDGLTAMQRELFLGSWLNIATAPMRAQGAVQMGMQGRTQ